MVSRDDIYSDQMTVEDFVFDDKVAEVFNDMISRSVPGYRTTISTISVLAERFVTAGSHCYDLGCSLGASTLAMRNGITAQGCKIFAVDSSPAMVKRCQSLIDQQPTQAAVEVVCADLRELAISNASMIVMNFTLQFISPDERLALMQRIAAGLNPGGVLVLSEKLLFDNTETNQLLTDLHHRFKRSNGYSDLEIAQKRAAIEHVLIPDTLDTHRERLQAAGFQNVEVWFQCFNFASLIAIKSQ